MGEDFLAATPNMSLIVIIAHTLLLLIKYHSLASIMLYLIKETISMTAISTMRPGLQWTHIEYFNDTRALSPIHSLFGYTELQVGLPIEHIWLVGCSLMYPVGFPFL